MRISELAVDAVFTPSGPAGVVVRPHPPSRPPDVLAEIADLASARSPS